MNGLKTTKASVRLSNGGFGTFGIRLVGGTKGVLFLLGLRIKLSGLERGEIGSTPVDRVFIQLPSESRKLWNKRAKNGNNFRNR